MHLDISRNRLTFTQLSAFLSQLADGGVTRTNLKVLKIHNQDPDLTLTTMDESEVNEAQ